MRFVFPVLEKYSTQIFMTCYFAGVLHILFGNADVKNDEPLKLANYRTFNVLPYLEELD